MNRHVRFVALVCIAVFAFTAIAAVPTLALLDAETPVDALFGLVRLADPFAPVEASLPAAPSLELHAPRPPPL